MIELKRHLIERFETHLDEQYSAYCERHGVLKDERHLVGYLIDQTLIPTSNLLRFTVIQEYMRLSTENNCPKTQAVEMIASRFALSERTVWSILKGVGTKKK